MSYKLKDKNLLDEYINWSLEKDQPLINSFKEIKEFSVFNIKGPKKDLNIFEIIKIDKYESWEKIITMPEVKRNTEQWSKLVDKDSVILFYGEKIINRNP